MRLFFTLARKYPWQTILTLVAILFAGISEGFGVSSLLPLLNTLFNQASQDGAAAGSQPAWSQTIDQIVKEVLGVIGLAPSVAILLSLFVACIALKCLLVYLANKQIGLHGGDDCHRHAPDPAQVPLRLQTGNISSASRSGS